LSENPHFYLVKVSNRAGRKGLAEVCSKKLQKLIPRNYKNVRKFAETKMWVCRRRTTRSGPTNGQNKRMVNFGQFGFFHFGERPWPRISPNPIRDPRVSSKLG